MMYTSPLVHLFECVSAPFHVKNKVQQGSLLAPFLFNLCMYDLSDLSLQLNG